MEEEGASPSGERGNGLTAIEQVAGIHAVGCCAGATTNLRQNRREGFISCGELQNAEGVPPELGSLGDILRLGMIPRRRPGLIHMQDLSALGNANPQVMVEHEMKNGIKFPCDLQCGAAHEHGGLTDNLEAEQIFES